MPPRACRKCGAPFIGAGWLCPLHRRSTSATRDPRYDDPAYRRVRGRMLREVRQSGAWCPGYGRPPHPMDDPTLDHTLELSRGGELTARSNLVVMCRSCNDRKRHAKR